MHDEIATRAQNIVSSTFVENRGQLSADEILYYSTSRGGGIGFAESAVFLNVIQPMEEFESVGDRDFEPRFIATPDRFAGGDGSIPHNDGIHAKFHEPMHGNVLKLSFVDSDPAKPVGMDPLPWYSNYFIGNDGSKWRPHVQNYEKIVYESLWPGIDLVYRAQDEGTKYEFVVHPGAKTESIKIKVEGANALSTDGSTLNIHTTRGLAVKDANLRIFYQDTQEIVKGQFSLIGNNTYTFILESYDITRTIIIDPLMYSTYLGGNTRDHSNSIAADSSGYAYITGYTWSADFPTTIGAYDTTFNGDFDVFVGKLNSAGTDLIYSTFLGGTEIELGCGIAVDSSGYAYIAGYTISPDFPTTIDAYDTTFNGDFDVFVSKLNSAGTGFIYSTFLGDTNYEEGYAIAVDSSGHAYITGHTNSTGFPTTAGAYDITLNGLLNVFVSKLNSAGTDLIYSTFLGGTNVDVSDSIAVDSSGYAYITGATNSSGFPTTPGAYDTTFNWGKATDYDVFVSKLNSAGTDLIYSTFLGAAHWERGYGIAVDPSGYAYITGLTDSIRFPTTVGAYDTTFNGGLYDVFVSKLNISGTGLVYSTFLGGADWEGRSSIAVNSSGYAYITGSTTSADFPTTVGAYDTMHNGLHDVFVSKLSITGTSLVYATFLGGTSADFGYDITVDSSGNEYITGTTYSTDFPTTAGAYDATSNGEYDVFVSKFDLITVPLAPQNLQADTGDSHVNLTWDEPEDDGGSPITGYNIYRNGSAGAYANVPETQLWFNDTEAVNGLTYDYNVSAHNAVGEGPNSSVSATPMTVPSKPENLHASAGDGYVSLTWNAPSSDGGSPITNYIIYRGETLGGVTFLAEIGNLQYYDDIDVTNGETYYYMVSAKNDVGLGPLSDEALAKPIGVPGPPRDLTATPSDGEILLTWCVPASNGGSPITNYRIYRGTSSGQVSFHAEVGNVLTYTDTGLTNGKRYYYRVRAINSVGEGALSVEVSAIPLTKASAPENLTAVPGDGRITLSWDPPADDGGSSITNYRIYRGTSSGSKSVIAEVGNVLTYTDTGLTNGKRYYYQVSAVNGAGEGKMSGEASAIPLTTPSAPENLTPVPGDGKITLSWAPPEDDGGSPITGYRLYGGTSPDDMTLLIELEGDILTYTDTGLTNGQVYYYRISAVNSAGEGEKSSKVSAIPLAPSSPSRDNIEEFWWLVLLLILIVIIVLIILFYIRRRRKHDKEAEESN